MMLLFSLARSDCYLPDGNVTHQLSECLDDTRASTPLCCVPGDLCLENTLCAHGTSNNDIFFFYRGGCRSNAWSGDRCPNFCLGGQDSKDGMLLVLPCPGEDNWWYCESNPPPASILCKDWTRAFSLPYNLSMYGTAGITHSMPSESSPVAGNNRMEPVHYTGTKSSHHMDLHLGHDDAQIDNSSARGSEKPIQFDFDRLCALYNSITNIYSGVERL
ncbi:hypothetical protein B0T17DRAFT_619991 [Bombardia bombarda]|uniref:Uncharacterized protein n=1 Tax=Bombardia bombarda TaxID=252184 RepID=A0AA39WGW8_9PEZI|nr:hypothetical protein B0T17DRAFT_619991 [Bombardia bombarda]